MTSDPVFVYGALRSGSTVLRLMLDRHEAVGNPGEVDFLFDHLRRDAEGRWRYDREALAADRVFRSKGMAPPDAAEDGRAALGRMVEALRREAGGRRLTLNIHRRLDRALELFPSAKVIHLLRDPRDVARSSIGMGWAGDVWHGVGHWIETERAWDGARARLAEGQALELRYERLFTDLEAELRRVCAFLEAPWSPSMLRYHETSTYDPPDPKLVEQWRRKASARELGLVEGRVGALLEARGYAPSGAAPIRPRGLSRLGLVLRNKLFRWRRRIRRYGFWLFAMERLTRRAGLSASHRRLRERAQAIDVAHLK